MAYDEVLADRIRELLADRSDVTETAMFGGLAFLVQGHLAIAASRSGGALVRVDPVDTDKWTSRGSAEVAVMRGRPAPGWLLVDSDHLRTTRQLTAWVHRTAEYAASLPPKKRRPARRRRAPSEG